MFRKKKPAQNNIQSRQSLAPAPSATPSASSAAALAFLQKQSSDANLSNAAAAAALRSHTTSPMPVGDVQTKRMIRKGSVSSHGSPAGSLRQPMSTSVQRRGSSGSMSERSFRVASPGPRTGAPPVPTLPTSVPTGPAQSTARVASPTLPSALKTTNTTQKTTQPAQPSSPGGSRQVNFSRPMSPPLEPRQAAVQQKARPASSLGFASTAANKTQQQVLAAGNQPVPKNRVGMPAQGSHLAAVRGSPTKPSASIGPAALTAATLAARPTPTAQQAPPTRAAIPPRTLSSDVPPRPIPPATPPRAVASPAPSPATSSKAVQTPSPSNRAALQASANASSNATQSATAAEQARQAQAKATAMLARPLSSPSDAAASSPTTKAPVIAGAASQAKPVEQTPPKEVPAQAPKVAVLEPATPSEVKRTSSVSPNRSAHFAETPLLDAGKHQPLPRAISPAKSALKNSPRDLSPAAASEASDAGSNDGLASAGKKKKSARVSFEPTPVLVGEAATSNTPADTILSPQYSKFPIGTLPGDESSSMAPRPVLPSFGSIRGRKEMEAGSEASTSSTAEAPLAASADENLAAIVARDVATKTHHETIESNTTLASEVPAIAVNPPTPRMEMETEPEMPVIHDDEESENSAEVYSDAAEDLSEVEEEDGTGQGFASLDAILESPVAETAPATETAPVVDSAEGPAKAVSVSSSSAAATPGAEQLENWDTVTAYWNSLSEQQKRELEARATPTTNGVGADTENFPPWPDEQYQQSVTNKSASTQSADRAIGEGNKPFKNKTMRSMSGGFSDAEADDEGPARPAARAPAKGAPVKMAATKGVAPKATTQRPAPAKGVAGLPPPQAASGVPKTTLKKPTPPPLARTFSDDSSDSDGSFRRRRAARAANRSGGMGMRSSMRSENTAAPPARPTSPPTTMRASMRSPSPQSDTASRKPLRSSMRGSVDSTGPTLRGQSAEDSKRSSLLGFKRSGKTKGSSGGGGSGFRSRFADSSDDDDGPPAYQSRFAADSDDDNVNSPLGSPVQMGRGGKKGRGRRESTDFSSDDNAVTANGTSPVEGKKSRRSILGFHRQKPSKDGSISNSPAAAQVAGSPTTGSPTTSKQTETMPRTMRSSSVGRSPSRQSFISRLTGSRPTTPKPEAAAEEHPFPPPPIPDEYLTQSLQNRPNTSEGVAEKGDTRPTLGSKRESSMTAPPGTVRPDKPIVVSSRTGKKKRFQGLRRIFGLND